jgi:hypothetical protein
MQLSAERSPEPGQEPELGAWASPIRCKNAGQSLYQHLQMMYMEMKPKKVNEKGTGLEIGKLVPPPERG